MSRFWTRMMAQVLGLGAALMVTPALAHCYKFENKSTAPRKMVIVGSGGLTATIPPAATWPERGEYCIYGMTLIMTIEPPGSFGDYGTQITAGDSPTALKSGTYAVK